MQSHPSRTLGASGLAVFPLGLGTNKWALDQGDEAIFEVFRASLDTGVNFIDTAEVYTSGRSERLVGACLRRDPRPVVVASKFAPLPTRLSSRQFMRALDASLSRLGLQTLDLYLIHFPFTLLSVERLMDLLAEAVSAGKVRAVGVSNFSAQQMRRAAARLARYHIPLAANEVHYSLLHRHPEMNGVLAACRELDVALVAYRPLEGGQLIGGRAAGQAASGESAEPGALLQTLRTIAQQHDATVSQVALNWLVRRDDHVIPIVGATTARHAAENATALSWELSDEEFNAIDRAASSTVR
jgi:aryl-alcohol dehydrogenase-like predicted oxidoreductase